VRGVDLVPCAADLFGGAKSTFVPMRAADLFGGDPDSEWSYIFDAIRKV
jgi:hypothetical protein